MRRTAAVILGTAALLGALATPASAAPASGTVDTTAATAASLVATARNAITGVQMTVGNVTRSL